MPAADERLFRVVKRYYVLHENQDAIAHAENISKSTISRLLKKAEQMGYVRHVVNVPLSACDELERGLSDAFPLRFVRVLPSNGDGEDSDPRLALFDVTLAAGQYLNQSIRPHEVIGVTWGRTLKAFADNLPECASRVDDVRVIQLNGSISRRVTPTYGDMIVRRIADNYDGECYSIPAPSFADTPELRDAMMRDSTIAALFSLVNRCSTVLFSVGCLDEDSVILQAGYLSAAQYGQLRRVGFCADICSRYIKADGSHEDDELYNRVIGISLERIREVPCSICMVAEPAKAAATLAALRGGYLTHLFIDEVTARRVLELA